MSDPHFQEQNNLYKSETIKQNRTNNNNKRNNVLTEYFDRLLKSNEFHKIIIFLLGSGILCIVAILLFIIIELFNCGTISSALDLLYKIDRIFFFLPLLLYY